MVKKLIIAGALIFGLAIPAYAADISSTTCPGAGCVTLNSSGQVAAAIQVTGTFVGTITFQTSVDNSTYVTTLVLPAGSGTAVSTATAPGLWTLDLKGIKSIRVVFTAYTSGTASVIVSMIAR